MSPENRLEGWKEIASYIRRSVKTARRWEELGMPVRRMEGKKGQIVFAFRDEIEAWRTQRETENGKADDGGTVETAVRSGAKLAPAAAFGVAGTVFGIGAILLVQWAINSPSAPLADGTLDFESVIESSIGELPPVFVAADEFDPTELDSRVVARGSVPDYFEVIGDWSFDEPSGRTAVDASGHGHDGLIFGAARVPGLSGSALLFDGIDDRVGVPHSDDLDVRGAITIEAVVQCANGPATAFAPIVAKGVPGATDTGYTVFGTVEDARCSFGDYLSTSDLTLNEWHHVVYQQDGNVARFYVDGRLDTSFAADRARASTPSLANLEIGGSTHPSRGYFAGKIDRIRISRGLVQPIDFLDFCARDGVRLIDTSGTATQHATVQAAIDAATPGSTVEVNRGEFREVVDIDAKREVTLISPCGATLDGVRIGASHDITIKGFTVDGVALTTPAIHLRGGAQPNQLVKIIGTEVRRSGGAGIAVDAGNLDITLKGNHVHSNAGDGVRIGASDQGIFVRQNMIENNGRNGVNIGSHRNLLIDRNTIIGNGTAASGDDTGYGLWAERSNNGAVVGFVTLQQNIIARNGGQPMEGRSSADIANFDEIVDGFDYGNATTCGCEYPGDDAHGRREPSP